MNYKLAITLLKTIDKLEGLEDLLEEHNGSYILVLRKLADVNESLAEQVETLELAAPYLFIEDGKLEPKAKQHCKENDVVIRKGTMIKYKHPKANGTAHLALVTGYSDNTGYSLSFIDDVGRYTQSAQLDHMQLLYRSSWLWQFPWSYKGYSSRRAHRRDITNAPTKVVNHYQ